MAPRNPNPVPEFDRNVPRRGVASPTGAVVRPSVDPTLTGLVEGLSVLQPSLQRFTQDFVTRSAQEQQAAGIEAARGLVEKGLSLAEATRQGMLPQQDNPWFMAGFHEKMGQSAADRWHTQLIEDMSKSPELKESTSTDDAQDFINSHRQKWLESNAPQGRANNTYFAQGFGIRSDARTQDEMVKFASRLEDRLTKTSTDLHFSQVKQHLEKEFVKGITPEEIAQGINIMVQGQYSIGTKEKQLDETTIHAIAAAAMDLGDDRALAVLKHVYGSKSGAELGDTLQGSEAIDKARQDIRNRKWNQEQRDWQLKQRSDQERLDGVLADAMMAKIQDPNFDLKTFAPKLKDMPEGLAKLAQMENQMNVLNNRTNEQVRSELFTKIFVFERPEDQTTEEDIAVARSQNLLTTEDASSLIAQIRGARESGKDKEQGIWNDFQFRQHLSDIDAQFRGALGEYENNYAATSAAFARAMFMERWDVANRSGGVPAEKKAAWLTDNAQEVINVARGPQKKGIQPRPAPQFQSMKDVEARLPTDLTLDAASLEMGRRGQVSTQLQQQFDALNLRTPSEKGALIKSQLKLYMQKHGALPPSLEAGDAKKEE